MAAAEIRFAPELNEKEAIELLQNATPGSTKKAPTVWHENISRRVSKSRKSHKVEKMAAGDKSCNAWTNNDQLVAIVNQQKASLQHLAYERQWLIDDNNIMRIENIKLKEKCAKWKRYAQAMERELLIEKQQRGANIKQTNRENTILNTENNDFKGLYISHLSRRSTIE